jgi:hypothetical protein
MLKLRDWIEIDKLSWDCLSKNPNAIELLKKIRIILIGLGYLQILMQLNF